MRITEQNYEKIPSNTAMEAVPGKNGFHTLLLKNDNGERLIHSKYDPVKEARTQTAHFLPLEKLTVLVFGLGMGYHIYEILNNLPDGGRVYIFEPNPYACRLFAENCGTTLLYDDRVRLYSSFSADELKQDVAEALTVENCDSFCFYAHPVYASLYPQEHDTLVGEINTVTSGLRSQKNTIRHFGKIWSENFLKNYKYLYKSAAVSGLFGLFKGKTAIIVSAGPSLSKNVSQLQEAAGKAVVICTDTAYKELEEHGIRPHLIVTTSGNPAVFYKLNGLNYGEIPLVYKSQSSNRIIKEHTGRKFYAGHINSFLDDALTQLGKPPGAIASGGSVACSCLDLATKTGVRSIVLIGQDFALTDGKEYAQDVFGKVPQSDLDNFLTETTDIYGNPVKTLKNLNLYRRWFEDYINAHPKVRFIDATEGGALIQGTEIKTLIEALSLLGASFNIEERIDGAFQKNAISAKETEETLNYRYKSAYDDFLKARELLTAVIGEYTAERPLIRERAEAAIEQLSIYTEAVKYSILADIYDLKNMIPGKDPAKELEAYNKIALALNNLTACFMEAVDTEA